MNKITKGILKGSAVLLTLGSVFAFTYSGHTIANHIADENDVIEITIEDYEGIDKTSIHSDFFVENGVNRATKFFEKDGKLVSATGNVGEYGEFIGVLEGKKEFNPIEIDGLYEALTGERTRYVEERSDLYNTMHNELPSKILKTEKFLPAGTPLQKVFERRTYAGSDKNPKVDTIQLCTVSYDDFGRAVNMTITNRIDFNRADNVDLGEAFNDYLELDHDVTLQDEYKPATQVIENLPSMEKTGLEFVLGEGDDKGKFIQLANAYDEDDKLILNELMVKKYDKVIDNDENQSAFTKFDCIEGELFVLSLNKEGSTNEKYNSYVKVKDGNIEYYHNFSITTFSDGGSKTVLNKEAKEIIINENTSANDVELMVSGAESVVKTGKQAKLDANLFNTIFENLQTKKIATKDANTEEREIK